MGCFHEMVGVIFAIFQYFAKKIEKKSEKKFSEKLFFLYFGQEKYFEYKKLSVAPKLESYPRISFFLDPSHPPADGRLMYPPKGGQNFKSAQTFF